MSALEVEFLSDGAQTPEEVAGRLAAWIAEATASLDVAIYDFQAGRGAAARVARALEEAAARGVRVRLVFNASIPRHATAPRPPSCNAEELEGLNVPTRPVGGEGSLMHHKYAVRDGRAVWTGSTNWTDEAFSREENVIIRVEEPEVAATYTDDFERLWERQTPEAGGGQGPTTHVGTATVRPLLSPKGPSLAQEAAGVLGSARDRIRVLSPCSPPGRCWGPWSSSPPEARSTWAARTTSLRWMKFWPNGKPSRGTTGRSRLGR